MQNKRIRLVRLSEEHTVAFNEEMQEAFQHGFEAYNKDAEETNQWQVLPDKDFYQSLNAEGAEAYEAINEDGQRVGGAIDIWMTWLLTKENPKSMVLDHPSEAGFYIID